VANFESHRIVTSLKEQQMQHVPFWHILSPNLISWIHITSNFTHKGRLYFLNCTVSNLHISELYCTLKWIMCSKIYVVYIMPYVLCDESENFLNRPNFLADSFYSYFVQVDKSCYAHCIGGWLCFRSRCCWEENNLLSVLSIDL